MADELTRWLDEDVYPRLDHSLFFGHLERFRRSGHGYVACCPAHDDRHPSFWMPDGRPYGRCFACGYFVTWWQVLEERGLTGRQVIEEFARLAGVPPLLAGDPAQARKVAEETRLVEEWWQARREALRRPEGQGVLAYLRSRGYTDEWVREMDVGVHPGLGAAVPGGLRLPPPEYRLLIPARSRGGRILGFAGRRLDGGVPKYQYSPGLGKAALLWGQHRLRQGQVPVVVEGVLDIESLAAAGIEGAVGLGGAQASAEQIRLLTQYRRAILALDQDPTGQAATEKLVRQLAAQGVRTYVAELRGAKDPDELLRQEGPDAVKETIRRAVAGPKWLVRRLAPDPGVADQERDAALERVLDFAESLTRVDSIAAREALTEAAATFRLTEAALAGAVERIAKKRREEYRRRRWEKALAEAQEAAAKGEHVQIPKIMRAAEADVAAATEPMPEPVDPAAMESFLAAFPPGLPLPWNALNTLFRIDPGGMTVVAAGTSHGKSTFLYLLLLHWLKKQEGAIIFWSGEIVSPVIWARLTGIEAGFSLIDILRQYREGMFAQEVLRAKEELARTAEGRLYLWDDPLSVDELATRVRVVARQQPVTALMIDYLQMLAPPQRQDGSRYGTREQEVTAVAKVCHDLAVELNIPVIAAAQISRNNFRYSERPRLTDLRESGGIEQYAQAVLGLWNASMAARVRAVSTSVSPAAPPDGWYWAPFSEEDCAEADAAIAMALSHQMTMVEAIVLKSRRRGHVGKAVPLAMDGATGRIIDLPTVPGNSTAATHVVEILPHERRRQRR